MSDVALEPPGDDPDALPLFRMRVMELHRVARRELAQHGRGYLAAPWATPTADPSGDILWSPGQTVEWNGQVPFPVLAALVRLDDDSLLTVTMYVRADVPASAHAEYEARGRRTVRSFRMERRWRTARGERELGPELAVDVPDGVRTTCHRYEAGELLPERFECGLRLIQAAGDPARGAVGFRWMPAAAPRFPSNVTGRVPSHVLGNDVSFELTEGAGRVLRAQVPFDEGRVLRLFVQASDEPTQRELLQILTSLRRR